MKRRPKNIWVCLSTVEDDLKLSAMIDHPKKCGSYYNGKCMFDDERRKCNAVKYTKGDK